MSDHSERTPRTLADIAPEQRSRLLQMFKGLREGLPSGADLRIARAWLRLAFILDENQALIHGHTILERIVPNILNAVFVSPSRFDHFVESYSAQIRLCTHLGIFDAQEHAALKNLVKLRNAVAHGTRDRITFEDEIALRREFARAKSFRVALGIEPEANSFPSSFKYFLFCVGMVLDSKRERAQRLIPVVVPDDAGEQIVEAVSMIRQVNQFGLYGLLARAMLIKWQTIEENLLELTESLGTAEEHEMLDKVIELLQSAGPMVSGIDPVQRPAGNPRSEG